MSNQENNGSTTNNKISDVLSNFARIQSGLIISKPLKEKKVHVEKTHSKEAVSKKVTTKKTINKRTIPKREKAEIDWGLQCKKFLKRKRVSPSDEQFYAEHKRLDLRTFRKELKKYIRSKTFNNSLNQQTVMREMKKRQLKQSRIEHGKNSPGITLLDNGCRTFREGNKLGEIHGICAKINREMKSLAKKSGSESKELLLSYKDILNQRIKELKITCSDCISMIKEEYMKEQPIIFLKLVTASTVVDYVVPEFNAISEVKELLTAEINELQNYVTQIDELITS